jgi:hypothetical protein
MVEEAKSIAFRVFFERNDGFHASFHDDGSSPRYSTFSSNCISNQDELHGNRGTCAVSRNVAPTFIPRSPHTIMRMLVEEIYSRHPAWQSSYSRENKHQVFSCKDLDVPQFIFSFAIIVGRNVT